MYAKFFKILAWNSSTTFIYKIVLLLHQILMYSIIPPTIYGLQSSLFACIYTIISLTNFGFEETLVPFFSTFSKSKRQFSQLLLYCKYQICITAIIALSGCIIIRYSSEEFLHNINQYCNKNFIYVLALLFFVESTKKSLTALLQLAFLQKQIAYAQIGMISAYITLIWVIFFLHQQITISDIFIPMLITSTLELGYLAYVFSQFYNHLPDQEYQEQIPYPTIREQRMYNYIHQIIKALYSSNSMTLFFAYFLGFQQAATIKFFTNIITLCYTCIAKIMTTSTGAILSTMRTQPLPIIKTFFIGLTQQYIRILSLLSSIGLIIMSYAYYHMWITKMTALQILLFFSFSFLESISITYEQLYISQGRSKILAYIHACAIGAIAMCYYWLAYNPIIFITSTILIKIIALAYTMLLTKKEWFISV